MIAFSNKNGTKKIQIILFVLLEHSFNFRLIIQSGAIAAAATATDSLEILCLQVSGIDQAGVIVINMARMLRLLLFRVSALHLLTFDRKIDSAGLAAAVH